MSREPDCRVRFKLTRTDTRFLIRFLSTRPEPIAQSLARAFLVRLSKAKKENSPQVFLRTSQRDASLLICFLRDRPDARAEAVATVLATRLASTQEKLRRWRAENVEEIAQRIAARHEERRELALHRRLTHTKAVITPEERAELAFQLERGVACWKDHEATAEDPDDLGRWKLTISCGPTKLGTYIAERGESTTVQDWMDRVLLRHNLEAAIGWVQKMLVERVDLVRVGSICERCGVRTWHTEDRSEGSLHSSLCFRSHPPPVEPVYVLRGKVNA